MGEVRRLTKLPAAMEDLATGVGKIEQTRGGKTYTVGKVDVPYAVLTLEDLLALDTAQFTYAKYDNTLLRFVPGATSGVYEVLGVGWWVVEGVTSNVATAIGNDLVAKHGAKPLTDITQIDTHDNSDEIEAWLAEGGRCTFPPGVFVLKRPVVGRGLTLVEGACMGVGTGGLELGATSFVEGLIQEANEGSSIIYVHPLGSWYPIVQEKAILFEELRSKNLPTVGLANFKICSDIDNPAPVGLIETRGAYDNLIVMNVNAMFGGDNYPVVEFGRSKAFLSFQLSQSINLTGLNAIGATGGNRTAPTAVIDWVQEGTVTSCKFFGSPYRVDGGGNPLYSSNDCLLVKNSRGLLFAGSSFALTKGNGVVFKAVDRPCLNMTLDTCTYELLGQTDGSKSAVVVEGSTEHLAGRVHIAAPRLVTPVHHFLRANKGFAITGQMSYGKVILEADTASCALVCDELAQVTDNSGKGSNLVQRYSNGISSNTVQNKNLAVSANSPALILCTDEYSAAGSYKVSWDATPEVDYGTTFKNSRAGKYFIHTAAGDLFAYDGISAALSNNYVGMSPNTGLIHARTGSPSMRLIAGDNEEHEYRVTNGANTASGVVSALFAHIGTPASFEHLPNGDIRLNNGTGEAGIVVRTSTGATKRITVTNEAEILINGVKVAGKGFTGTRTVGAETWTFNNGLLVSVA